MAARLAFTCTLPLPGNVARRRSVFTYSMPSMNHRSRASVNASPSVALGPKSGNPTRLSQSPSVLVVTVCRSTLRTLHVIQLRRFGLQIRDQVGCVVLGDTEHRHAHAGKLCNERNSDGVVASPRQIGVHDETFEPGAFTTVGDSTQVRPHPVPYADRMAGSAYFFEQRLARPQVELITRIAGLVVLRPADFVTPFRIHGADIHDEAVEIAEHRVPCPLTGRIVTQDDFIAMFAQRPALVAERGVDQSDITRLSGQKQPSWASGECFGKTLEPFRRIALRIDGQ